MAKLVIEGVPPFDGAYDLDIGKFNGRELHTIKQISGVRGGELREALDAGDYDLVVAFAVIVLRRAGKVVDPEQILEADVGAITIDLGVAEVEERPPDSPSPSGSKTSHGDSVEPSAPTPLSGEDSRNGGVLPPSLPSLTGPLGSDITVASDPVTSAS